MVFTTQNDMGGLGQAIQGLGGTLGQALQQRGQKQQQQLHGTILQEELSKLEADAGQAEFMNAITTSIKRGVPIETGLKYAQTFKPDKIAGSQKEKVHNLKVGMSTVNEMQKLMEGGNVGTLFGFPVDPTSMTGQKGEDRSKFKTMGKSLIPLVAANVSIRNQREFDEYKETITNANASTANIKGALSGLLQLMGTQLQDYTGEIFNISSLEGIDSTSQAQTKSKKANELAKLPSAAANKGKTFKETESGKSYKSDGTRWKEV